MLPLAFTLRLGPLGLSVAIGHVPEMEEQFEREVTEEVGRRVGLRADRSTCPHDGRGAVDCG